jgi:hypothetical protein
VVRTVATVRPGAEACALAQPAFISGIADGAVSCCTVVCAYSFMPLAEEASTGNCTPPSTPAFSFR